MEQKILGWTQVVLGSTASLWSLITLMVQDVAWDPKDPTFLLILLGLFILLHGVKDIKTSSP